MGKSFYQYFRQNMEETGLPAPDSIFGSLTTATATISAITKVVQTYGTRVTVAELLQAGVFGGTVAAGLSEGLTVVGGMTAAFYLGACIGSLAVATGKWTADHQESIGEFLSFVFTIGLDDSDVMQQVHYQYRFVP